MKKILIIVAHPNLSQSIANRTWIEAFATHSDRYTVHDLYATYPGGNIDVAAEQALIEAHGSVIFQFPVYWFSSPPLLKQWFDSVFTHGWAFGSSATAFIQRPQTRFGRIARHTRGRLFMHRESRPYTHRNIDSV